MQVLLVEDNMADAWLVKELIFNESKNIDLTLVTDGAKATEYLFNDVQSGKKPFPDVMLLDIHLPKKSGDEVLKELRQNPAFKHLPVFILTTSKDEKEMQRFSTLGADRYFTKPSNLSDFVNLVKTLVDFEFPKLNYPASPHLVKSGAVA